MATKENPIYTAFIVDGETTYDITPIMTSIESSDQDTEMAQKYVINVMNVQINGVWSTSVFVAGQRVFIYCDDGETKDEVFRGYLWEKKYKSSNEVRDFSLICYDDLIYFQTSEDYQYFSSGKSSEDVLGAICEDWGVQLEYNYESITHDKLVLKGTLSNIFMSDILDVVQARTAKRYVIRMEKDVVKINTVGENTKIYQFNSRENVIQTQSTQTMDDMITKIVIFGKQGEGERAPVEATVEDNVDKYGTIQKVFGRNESSSLEDAKKEAENMVNLKKWPFWEYEVEAPDIPWIRKGDVVYINAGDIYQMYLIVRSVSRSISQQSAARMTLTLDDGKVRETEAIALSTTIATETPEPVVDSSGSTGTTGGTVGTVSDGSMTSAQQTVVNYAWSRGPTGTNECAKWVSLVFNETMGFYPGGNANNMIWNWCSSSGELKPGMIIGAASCNTGWAGIQYGHVAIYVGDGLIRSSEFGQVVTYTLDQFYNVYGTLQGLSWGWAGGVALA